MGMGFPLLFGGFLQSEKEKWQKSAILDIFYNYFYHPHQTTVMLSNALVIPHFDYGCTVWSNFSSELQNKVQVLYNNLARIRLSADIRTPVDDMMNALQWVKLEKI